jgi:hypothetical protein
MDMLTSPVRSLVKKLAINVAHIACLSHVCYMPAHLILIDLIVLIVFGDTCKL